MTSCNPIGWTDYQPVWLRVILFPVLVALVIVYSVIVLPFFILIVLPLFLVWGWIGYRRFWRRLRKRGQIGRWSEVEPLVTSGSGTLIVELTPKGPGCSWLLDVPRDEIDPEHVVPTWRQFEEHGWEVFESTPTAFEAMNRWIGERLGTYEASARALAPSWRKLAGLAVEVKQRSVLAVLRW